MNIDDYYTIPEAADQLGLTVQTIRNYLYLNKLRKVKIKSLVLIARSDVEEYQRLRT